jgi:hypothetical protein
MGNVPHYPMNLINILVGLAILLYGRQLFWIFVGGVGFTLGLSLAEHLLATAPHWQVLLIGLAIGVLGAFCAVVFERVAVTVAGFLAGGAIAIRVVSIMAPHADPLIWIVLSLAGGFVGALVVATLFDWALIVLSSAVGAVLVTDSIPRIPISAAVLFAVLLAFGIVMQARRLERGFDRRRGA